MAQDTQTATIPQTHQRSRFRRLRISVGILWLLLAVVLLGYQLLTPARVKVTWETATEQGTAGFNIYRSQDDDKGFLLVNDGQLIESRGDSFSGARYAYIDDHVERGKTYYYILEEIELDGGANRYENEVIEYTIAKLSWWAVALTIFSGAVGLVILINGLKEINQA